MSSTRRRSSKGCSPTAAVAAAESRGAARPRVELCEHAAAQLDLGALAEALRGFGWDVSPTVVDGLCEWPNRAGAGGLVAGLCRLPASPSGYRARAGYELEPEALALVPLALVLGRSADRGLADAAALLAAALAGLNDRPAGAGPVRVIPAQRPLTRRALFSPRALVARPVAAIAADACLGSEACARCVAACPEHALSPDAGAPRLTAIGCTACGACVADCPTGAISLEGVSLEGYAKRLEPLLARAEAAPRGIAFVDGEALPRFEAELRQAMDAVWLPLEVPSLALVTPGWVLQALRGGAAAVALVGADPRSTRPWREDRLAYCREVLDATEGSAGAARIDLVVPGEPLPPLAPGGAIKPRPVTLREPAATAQAIVALARDRPPDSGPVAGSASPLGIAHVDESRCSACGACIAACPARALSLAASEDGLSLRLDPSRCHACGACGGACPEQALTVERATDLVALQRGEVELHQAAAARCRSCGRAFAEPAPLVARVAELLRASVPAAFLAELEELCPDCAATAPTPT